VPLVFFFFFFFFFRWAAWQGRRQNSRHPACSCDRLSRHPSYTAAYLLPGMPVTACSHILPLTLFPTAFCVHERRVLLLCVPAPFSGEGQARSAIRVGGRKERTGVLTRAATRAQNAATGGRHADLSRGRTGGIPLRYPNPARRFALRAGRGARLPLCFLAIKDETWRATERRALEQAACDTAAALLLTPPGQLGLCAWAGGGRRVPASPLPVPICLSSILSVQHLGMGIFVLSVPASLPLSYIF